MSKKNQKETTPIQDERLAVESDSVIEPTEVIEVAAQSEDASPDNCSNCPDSSVCTDATDAPSEPESNNDDEFDYDDDDGFVSVIDDHFSLGKTLGVLALATLVVGASLFVLTRLLRDKEST